MRSWTRVAALLILLCAPTTALVGCHELDPGAATEQLGPVLPLAISPSSVERDATVTVALETSQDFFNPQTTVTVSGTGVTAGRLLQGDSRHAAVVVTVEPSALVGSRTMTAQSGGRSARGTLNVVASSQAPRVIRVEPSAAAAGTTLEVTVTCANTSFSGREPPALVLYAPTPAPLTNVVVLSRVAVRGTLTVPAIPPGLRPLYVFDGTTRLAGAFLIGRANSGSAVLDPPAAGQGERVPVQVVGTNTHFDVGSLEVSLPYGSGLQVLHAAAQDATHAELDLRIGKSAPIGPTTITLINDLYVVVAAFEVWPAPEITLTPAEAVEGHSLTVAIAGTATHFVEGVTTATSNAPEIQIDALRVLGPASAELDVTLPLNWLGAPVIRTVTVATRWEIAAATFTVQPAPRFVLQPAEVPQGEAATLQALGAFTHFVDGVTEVVLPPDPGFAVTVLTVLSETEALLDVEAEWAPPEGPRTVYLVTGDEVAAAALPIVPGTPAVVVTPTQARQGDALTVSVIGRQMGFGAATQVAWVPSDAEVQTLSTTVTDADHLSLDALVAFTAPVRTVGLEVTTTAAQLTTPFDILPVAAAPTIAVAPAEVRQGVATHVVVTGERTHFDSRTQLVVPAGRGISVAGLPVVSATRLEADLVLVDSAALGAVGVTAVTSGESAAGSVTVLPGLPRVDVAPATVTQGDGNRTLTLTAHFLAFDASTSFTVDPACDVTLTSRQVDSASQARLFIDVPGIARPGTCAVTATTAGVIGQGSFTILPGQVYSVPADVASSITSTQRTRYFAFTAPAGWLVYARVQRDLGTQLDPYVWLVDTDRHATLATNDDESPARTDALLVYRVPAAATYYFAVRDRLNATTGGFTIHLRRWQPETDTAAAAAAQPIDLAAASMLIRGDLIGSDTTNTFTLQAPDGYHFAADVVARAASPFPGSAAEVTLTLRAAGGAVLATSTDRGYGPDPVIYHEPTEAATLTLEVSRDPDTDPAGGFYLLNLRPAVVINEVYLESATIPDASFIELAGPPGLSLDDHTLVADGYSLSFATALCCPTEGCQLGPTGLAVLGHDALVVGATCVDAALAIPASGSIELQRNGVTVDTFTYSAASGPIRLGRGFTLDTDGPSDVLGQVEESSDEGNYTNVP